jgi:molybdate/tungstate transport system substrate-binding protein
MQPLSTNSQSIFKSCLWSLATILIFSLASCNKDKSNTLIIFHAGSLSVPLMHIADSFETKYPGVLVELEAAGSRTCARKIADLKKPCDIIASADYKVIDNLLIPEHCTNNYHFATNEMVIVYSPKSMHKDSITTQHWTKLLLRDDVKYGRSDPNADPCGYRAIMTMQLTEKLSNTKGITSKFLSKDREFIRPKASDLIALLESGIIDYIFEYRSVAEQNKLPYLTLPDSINLKKPALKEWYKQAKVTVSGKTPNDSIILIGEPMIYGLSPLNTPQNQELTNKFLHFFFTDSVGLKILEKYGQHAFVPNNL